MKKGEFYCDIKTLKKNIETEFHKELNDYCSTINLQVINYLAILTSDITEKIEIKKMSSDPVNGFDNSFLLF